MANNLTQVQLESLFEFYDQNNYREVSSRPSRHYKPGRVYGSPGEYGDKKMEDRYQAFISDSDLIEKTYEEYIYELENSVPVNNYWSSIYDTIRFETNDSDEDEDEEEEPRVVMCITARPTEIEEGEIVEDIYPNDLLEPEPFIRAPIASYEATEVVYNEFYAPTNPRALEYLNNRSDYYERTEADILRERLEDFEWRNSCK